MNPKQNNNWWTVFARTVATINLSERAHQIKNEIGCTFTEALHIACAEK